MKTVVLEISIAKGAVFKTEMHLYVYIDPRIGEIISQIDSRRQGWKLQGSVQPVPWRAPIILIFRRGCCIWSEKIRSNFEDELEWKDLNLNLSYRLWS